ncbi:MAG: radical SAM protein [Clostridia bacterium]|nr:radical SAM protein [Clostridia bacterium]
MSSIPDGFPFRLRSCVWEITLECCFRCKYCGSCGGKARENELTLPECEDVAGQLAEIGCRRVSLIGGEVFMRKDWEEIVFALTSRGIKVCVITNGFRMTQAILSALRRLNIESVAVSVDGPEEVHDAFRQPGSYRRAFEAIDALAEAGIPVSVISALRADNAPRLPEFFETLKKHDIFAWQLQACSPMGNANKNAVDVAFDAAEVMRFIAKVNGTAKFYVGAADNIGYYTPEEYASRGIAGLCYEGCGAGLVSVGIDSVGNVRGCESMYDERFNEGNLRERTLAEIWTDPESFSYNRRFSPSLLTGGCAGCEHGDICAGGCRSYNYFTTGKLYENILCPTGKRRQ